MFFSEYRRLFQLHTFGVVVLFSSNIQIRVRPCPSLRALHLSDRHAQTLSSGRRGLSVHSVPHRIREYASALSLASTSSSTHTSGPHLRSSTTRCPSGLALSSLSPTFIISSISPHGTLGQTARACSSPLLRSPVTLKGVHLGLSRASRLARRGHYTQASTPTHRPAPCSRHPDCLRGPRLARRLRHGVNGGGGGSAGCRPGAGGPLESSTVLCGDAGAIWASCYCGPHAASFGSHAILVWGLGRGGPSRAISRG